MNVTQQMEGVHTIVLTLMGVSSAAVTQDTNWMKMDWIAVVRAHELTKHFTWWHSYSCKFCSCHHTYIPNSAHVKSRLWIVATQLEVRNEKCPYCLDVSIITYLPSARAPSPLLNVEWCFESRSMNLSGTATYVIQLCSESVVKGNQVQEHGANWCALLILSR